MIVRTSRVKVGNRQAPHAAKQKPHPAKVGFLRLGTANLSTRGLKAKSDGRFAAAVSEPEIARPNEPNTTIRQPTDHR